MPDAQIQALCRWASPQSLQVYARLERSQYADLVENAKKVRFDAIQAKALWAETPETDNDDRYIFAEQLTRTMAAQQ